MNGKQCPETSAASGAARLIATHIHEQIEQISALVAGAHALLPESVVNDYAGDLLDLAFTKLEEIGDIEHLRRLMGAVAASSKKASQAPEASND